MTSLEDALLKNLRVFTAFTRNRLRDPQLAEDVVQDSLLKALGAERKPASEEAATTWFYRILRHAIIDAYRRRDARGRALQAFEVELNEPIGPEDERTLCGCLRLLVPTLKPEYAEAIARVELQQEPLESVARDLKLSVNNLRVRLHRGRKQLRERLEQTCRVCAKHGCLDCHCAPG